MKLNLPTTQLLNLILSAFLLLALAITVYSINQARSLQSEAKGKPSGSSATLTVSPNPVIAGGNFTITGSGFKPSQWIYFSTTCYGSFNVAVDSAGNTSFTRPAPIGAGVCTFDAYQYSGSRNIKLVLMATLTFQVVEQ